MKKNTNMLWLTFFALCLMAVCIIKPADANAAKSVKTSTKKVTTKAHGQTYGTISIENYYTRIVVKGKSAAVKKINKVLKKDCNNFLKNKGAGLVDYAKGDQKYKTYKDTYVESATSEVTYNKNNILSIKITTEWYAGGVSNTDIYGYTFNLKTGKQLKLNQVTKDSTSKVASTLKKAIKAEDAYADTNSVTKKNVKKMNFYLEPQNKAIVCFPPYSLGYGGWVRTYAIKSKYK